MSNESIYTDGELAAHLDRIAANHYWSESALFQASEHPALCKRDQDYCTQAAKTGEVNGHSLQQMAIQIRRHAEHPLLPKLHAAASLLSHYNAAEGKAWSDEREARNKAHTDLIKIKAACEAVGINVAEQLKGYLV